MRKSIHDDSGESSAHLSGKSMHFRKKKKTENEQKVSDSKHRYKSNSLFNYEIFMAQWVAQ